MNSIREQLMSFGYRYDDGKSEYCNVISFLNWSNNVDKTPSLLSLSGKVLIKELPLSTIKFHKTKMMNTYNKHIIDNGIAGIVISVQDMLENGEESYWLLDGYHRFTWLKQQGIKEYKYIIITP